MRKHLVKNTFTPPALAPTVPLVKFVMVNDLSAQDRGEFQTFIDFASKSGILKKKVDTAKYLKSF